MAGNQAVFAPLTNRIFTLSGIKIVFFVHLGRFVSVDGCNSVSTLHPIDLLSFLCQTIIFLSMVKLTEQWVTFSSPNMPADYALGSCGDIWLSFLFAVIWMQRPKSSISLSLHMCYIGKHRWFSPTPTPTKWLMISNKHHQLTMKPFFCVVQRVKSK